MSKIITTNGMRRSSNVYYMTSAELTIHNAICSVECLGADVRLTDAVLLLQQAKDKVSEVIDERMQDDDWNIQT